MGARVQLGELGAQGVDGGLILGQIEGQLSEMFQRAVAEQIISSFTGVSVNLDPEDPTAILVEAYYVPVFPLLYIQITLRVSAQQSAA